MNLPEKNPMNENNQNQDPQWFDEVIASYDYQSPQTGQVIEGTLIRIDDEGALVDIGVKRDAIVPSKDLSQVDKEILSKIKVGEKVLVYVTHPATGDHDLQVSISRALEYRDWQAAENLLISKESAPLKVAGYNRGGLIIEYNILRGFLPFSQVPELRSTNNPRLAETMKREMVGQILDLKVIEVVPDRNRLIFSAMEAQSERRKKRLASLKKGLVLEGKVASIVDFGVFVDLDGVDGLVHVSQLDWKKVKHPSELVKVGDPIQVKVTEVDLERERVSLSRKTLLPSPWETIGEVYHVGDFIEVTITRVVEFGAFARLDEGIEGLIHSSQIGYSSSQSLKDAIKPGDKVLVKVLEINSERRRMALSMRQVPLEKQIAWSMDNLPPALIAQPQKSEQTELAPPVPEGQNAQKDILDVIPQEIEEPIQAEEQPEEPIQAEGLPEELNQVADAAETQAVELVENEKPIEEVTIPSIPDQI